jgi:hypothetical protein
MMSKYNHWLAKIFWFFNGRKGVGYAVTIGQTAYFSCDKSLVTKQWQAHEDCHKNQWARDGKVKFLSRYVWQLLTKGYSNIDYEVEARAAGKTTLNKEV